MKSINLILIYIFFFMCVKSEAAFSERFSGARPMAMAGSFASVADDLNSIYYNPAGLSSLTGISVSCLWTRYYSLEELQNIVLSAGVPTSFGSFAMSYQSYGFDLYRESELVLSHGLYLLRVLQFGYSIKYSTLALKNDPAVVPVVDYGSDSFFSFDFGIKGDIDSSFSMGAYAMNVNAPRIGKNNGEESEQKFCFSVGYRPVHGLTTTLTFDKALGDEYRMRAGAEIWVYKFVALRMGVVSRPFNFSLGLGVNYNILYFDYAMVNNLTLGQTHVLSLSMMMGAGPSRGGFIEKKPKAKEGVTEETYYTGPKVNINTATAEELGELPRVGPKLAEKIIEYRNQNGLFKSIEDLKNVKGIGEKTFLKMKNMVTTGEEPAVEQKVLETKGFDINNAQLKDFVDKGISPLKAIRIIKYREEKGGIKDLEELKLIEGITEDDVAKIKALVEGK